MNICFISREFAGGHEAGGIGTYTHTAAGILGSRGHKVHVITLDTGRGNRVDSGFFVHFAGMLPHHLPTSGVWYPYRRVYRRLFPVFLEALTWARTAAAAFRTLAASIPFDIVECPDTMGEGALVPKCRGMRLIVRIHSPPLRYVSANPLDWRRVAALQVKTLRRADRITAPSRFAALARDGAVGNTPIRTGPNPFVGWIEDVDWSSKAPNHVLFAGRIDKIKGFDILLDALRLLSPNPGLRVRLIGGFVTNPSREEEAMAHRLEEMLAQSAAGTLGFELSHLGRVAHGEMRKHFDWAGILVIPSRVENFPYAALEGLSRGCFIVCSDCGGLVEIIRHAHQGLRFSPADPGALAGALRAALDLTDLKTRSRRARRELLEDYSPGRNYARILGAWFENGDGASKVEEG